MLTISCSVAGCFFCVLWQGGKKIIMGYAGKDASKPFTTIHNKKVLPKFGPRLKVGTLKK